MRFASRFFLTSSIFVLPTAFAAACTSFPDLVDVGALDGSVNTTNNQPTMVVTEADGAMVTVLLDGAPVPDSGTTTTGGDDSATANETGAGGDDSGTEPGTDSGTTDSGSVEPVDAGPDACTGTVDCSKAATANCAGCLSCDVASGCHTCGAGPNQLTCTNGLPAGFEQTEPCCASMGQAICSDAGLGGYSCAN